MGIVPRNSGAIRPDRSGHVRRDDGPASISPGELRLSFERSVEGDGCRGRLSSAGNAPVRAAARSARFSGPTDAGLPRIPQPPRSGSCGGAPGWPGGTGSTSDAGPAPKNVPGVRHAKLPFHWNWEESRRNFERPCATESTTSGDPMARKTDPIDLDNRTRVMVQIMDGRWKYIF